MDTLPTASRKRSAGEAGRTRIRCHAFIELEGIGRYPTYDIELWETGGGAPLATLVSGATLSSDTTGEVVSATWDASLLGTADGSIVELKVVGHRSGGNPTKRRTVEVGECRSASRAPDTRPSV